MVTNETSYDSVVMTKDTGVIRSLQIDGNNKKQRKTELKSKCPITRCFLKTDKSLIGYRALHKFGCR